jgi:branched-chain amino acid transport system permease protein
MPRLPRPVVWFLLLAAVLLASYPLWGETFYVRLITKVMVLAIFAMSLDLLVGYTGLVSLGHAAFFGVGGYVAGVMINKAGIVNGFALLPASLAASAAAAALIGWIAIRTTGIYFIMITLALAQMVYYFFHDLSFWGGADGINIDTRPVFGFGETALLDLSDRAQMFWLTFGLMVAVFLVLSMVLRSPFGRTIVGIRLNEGRMRALGYDVMRYKLAAFVIAGTIAGLAGFLEASRATFMNPAHAS